MYCIMGGEHLFLTRTKELDDKLVTFKECMKCGHLVVINVEKK